VNISAECHIDEKFLTKQKPTVFKEFPRTSILGDYHNTDERSQATSNITSMIKATVESPEPFANQKYKSIEE
jgi:hypothetical protein